MKKNKITALITAFIVTTTMFIGVSADFTPEQASCPDYLELKYRNFDLSQMEAILKKLNEFAENPDDTSEKEVITYAEILVDEFTHLVTMNNMHYIEFNLDVKSDEAYNNLNKSDEAYVILTGDIGDSITKLCDAGFTDVLRNISGYDLVNAFTYIDSDVDYSKSDRKNEKLIIEVEELIGRYTSYTEDDFSVDYDGETWTLSDLFNAEFIYSENELAEIATKMNKKRNKELGNIFLEILKKRDEIAENSGYDNYAEYAYEGMYLRDYTLDETEDIYDIVKEKISPVTASMGENLSYKLDDAGLFDLSFSEEELLDITADFLSDLNDDYLANLNHMRSKNLYNIKSYESKSEGSFMTTLNEYSVPFMLVSPINDFSDVTTVIHEFGHANAEYIMPSSAIWDMYGTSLDTCEMHSQGLEVLFASRKNSTFTDKEQNGYTQYVLYNLMTSIVEGCLYDEFQKFAYENPDVTLEELNKKYKQLCQEYQTGYSEEDYYTYDWVEIIHNYDAPMYYISYATSAVPVLDLWLKTMENPEEAEKIYESLTKCDSYTPYNEAADKCGLATIFDKEKLNEIAYQVAYYYENEEIDVNYVPSYNTAELIDNNYDYNNEEMTDEESFRIVVISMVIAGSICLVILAIVVCIVFISDRKKYNKQKNDFM